MVNYCCVVGCSSKSRDSKDPTAPTSIRLKFHCKTIRQTLLEKNVRKKLSKLIQFKNQ